MLEDRATRQAALISAQESQLAAAAARDRQRDSTTAAAAAAPGPSAFPGSSWAGARAAAAAEAQPSWTGRPGRQNCLQFSHDDDDVGFDYSGVGGGLDSGGGGGGGGGDGGGGFASRGGPAEAGPLRGVEAGPLRGVEESVGEGAAPLRSHPVRLSASIDLTAGPSLSSLGESLRLPVGSEHVLPRQMLLLIEKLA